MSPLTIEAIRKNPWNAVVRKLPTHPEPLLLELAYLAARYYRTSEHRLMLAARAGIYTPLGWFAETGYPDAHEESETYAFAADCKLLEICDRYEEEFGTLLQL